MNDHETQQQGTTPIYYFASRLEDEHTAVVEAHKSWQGGHQVQAISTHTTLTSALTAETELVNLKQEQGLQAAMQEAERRATAGNLLDPARTDGRMFTEGQADPFTTQRQKELDGLDYTYDVVAQARGTYQLQSIKTWQVDQERGFQALALGDYDRAADARAEQEHIQKVGKLRGLEGEMQAVERLAVENGTLEADRLDPRLFTQGPPDPFRTEREVTLEATQGYTFRAQTNTPDQHSLNLIHIEREGREYRATQMEVLRVPSEDAAYVTTAADKFNRMAHDHGIGLTVAAANTWAREHAFDPSQTLREVTPDNPDREHRRDPRPPAPEREL